MVNDKGKRLESTEPPAGESLYKLKKVGQSMDELGLSLKRAMKRIEAI